MVGGGRVLGAEGCAGEGEVEGCAADAGGGGGGDAFDGFGCLAAVWVLDCFFFFDVLENDTTVNLPIP